MRQVIDTNINYNILGYHKEETFDSKGDLIILKYYHSYDEQTDTFSNLSVEEIRTYTRDITTGLLTKRETIINWYDDNEVLTETKTNITKYYTAQKGYANNKRARQNLIDKASMYLLSQVGKTDATSFLRIAKNEISGYVAGDIQPLLDVISNSTEIYMTATIKATLDVILNISY